MKLRQFYVAPALGTLVIAESVAVEELIDRRVHVTLRTPIPHFFEVSDKLVPKPIELTGQLVS